MVKKTDLTDRKVVLTRFSTVCFWLMHLFSVILVVQIWQTHPLLANALVIGYLFVFFMISGLTANGLTAKNQ